MKRIACTLLLLSITLAAHGEALRLSEPVERGDGYEVYGAPLADASPGAGLAETLARAEDLEGQPVRVTTRVAKVCQKKGCFFIATEGAASARVTFADYGFFIPTDSGGKTVTLVGTLSRQALSPERAAHYAQDLGEAPPEAAAPREEYAIVATSVLIPSS